MNQHLLFKGSHENVGIGRCHSRAHGCTLYVKVILVVGEEVVVFGDAVEEVLKHCKGGRGV